MSTDTLEAQVFPLPDLGEGLTEAEIVEWKVAVGDTVEIDQIVVEVETAKAAVEVPVPYAGTVLRLHADAGTALAVGQPLISVGTTTTGDHAAPTAAERYREEEQAGSGNVLIGYGTGHAPASRRRRRSGPAQVAEVEAAEGASTAPTPGGNRPEARLVISPLVRKLARDNGVDVARLTPSGTFGVVRRQDVEEAIAQGKGAVAASTPADAVAIDAGERIPLRGLRRAVARKLARSRTEIPDATTWVDVDATALLDARNALRAAHPDRRIGLLPLLARICVAGLRRYPELNSTVDTEREEIVRFSHVNLGFAAQTERGLVVPVLRDANTLTTAQIATELGRLTDLARTGGLPPEALTGGTFTLNNYGVFGVDGSTPIINHPEAALLGVGRIVDKPWVVDGELAIRKVTQLSLSFDHRVCDGGVAGGFLRYVADCVERPATLLADM
ncbi:dihydrolipoamide acetyltransferase family protein [Streptomyces sp. NBC_00893]|uniref:dihydrolipoamide acetyltransferase family protein n=1 Tax=Streptomyces sp. NBC_00893 TaxID=2975862 RepID=UPI002255726D|nr:dihydrolipoamide acetyltransferase family protein [Streptomyces sp. NBC_00893]MCX4850577.1 2-oxo acid dehydrogenase subunit E2 [Streptomyces sp. NBC_00893]